VDARRSNRSPSINNRLAHPDDLALWIRMLAQAACPSPLEQAVADYGQFANHASVAACAAMPDDPPGYSGRS